MAAIDDAVAQMASLALAAYKAGRHDDAIDAFTKAISQQDSAVLRKNRAAVKAAQQDWTGAEADLTAALATDPPDALKGRILLKRSFVRAARERHAAAGDDAASAAALMQGPEREKCLAQAARCRRDAKRDADLLKATAADGQHMVHPAQKLRLAFASPLPETVEAGDAFEVEVRLGNEFGLWRPADWPTVGNGETTLVASARGGGVVEAAPVPINADGRARLTISVKRGGDFMLRISPEGDWRRRPLAVLSLPFTSRENKAGETCCRELALGSVSVVVAEAPARLGIGGKLWDAALALTAHVGSTSGNDECVHGKRVLELGSGVGAVGIGARLFGASRVVLTDIEDVVPLLAANIELNHVESVTAVALDWFQAVPSAILEESFDLILASDVVYDPELHAPLLKTLGVLLDRIPVCLLAHRRRNPHDADFFGALRARFDVAERVVSTGGGALVPEDVELFAVRRRVVC